jgi:hypothetical protein
MRMPAKAWLAALAWASPGEPLVQAAACMPAPMPRLRRRRGAGRGMRDGPDRGGLSADEVVRPGGPLSVSLGCAALRQAARLSREVGSELHDVWRAWR